MLVVRDTDFRGICNKKLRKAFAIHNVSNAKRTVCNCPNVDTTDIRLDKDGKYYHVLCGKPITN